MTNLIGLNHRESKALIVLIAEIFEGQQKGCGTRKIKKALSQKDHQVSRTRIGKLMAKAELIYKTKKKF